MTEARKLRMGIVGMASDHVWWMGDGLVALADVQLVAAVDNGLTVEYFHLAEDIFNFERLVEEPLEVRDGKLLRPDRPGHGVTFDRSAIERWTVAGALPAPSGVA